MFFLGGMEKNLLLLSSVCKMSVGKRCPGQHVHVPNLLTFEYKRAGEVTKCRNPMKTLYSFPLLASVSWLLAW